MSNHHWHYANRSGHQQGPVDAATLRAAFARGDVDAGSLVWRDGLAQWVTLSEVAGELGIAMGAVPPEVPGARPFATSGTASSYARPVKKGMSGGTIALVIVAVVVVLLGPLGVIAAIAIAQYQDYVAKAQFSEAVMLAQSYEQFTNDHFRNEGVCPDNSDLGGGSQRGKYVGRVEFLGGLPPCAITMVFADQEPTASPLRGYRVKFTGTPSGDDMTWECSSSLPDKFKPQSCRGAN